jgi:hypothetical protein
LGFWQMALRPSSRYVATPVTLGYVTLDVLYNCSMQVTDAAGWWEPAVVGQSRKLLWVCDAAGTGV